MKRLYNLFASQVIRKALLYTLFLVVILLIFFPFYWIIATSLKDSSAIYAFPPEYIPKHPTLENYRFSIEESNILSFSWNSLWVGVVSMILTVIISTMAAYPLTRMVFRGKRLFLGLLASTQVFPVVVTIIPLYILFRSMGLYNSLASLVLLYTATCVPVAIVLLTGYFRDIPKELEEAAVIDGCGRFRSFIQIVLPVVRSGIVAAGIYVFLSNWQEYLAASSLIADRAKYTLTLGLTLFQSEHSTNWGALMATAVLLAIPAVILFFCIQNYFIDSLAGSIKE